MSVSSGLLRLAFLASVNFIVTFPSLAQMPQPPDANKVSPTVSADISSEITTGSGYDAWTGSVRRRVVDIEVPGAVSSQGLKYVRTYSSSTNEWVGSYSWFIFDRPDTAPIAWNPPGIVHMPDGRKDIKGAKERLFEINTDTTTQDSRSGYYDLYLEDGSRVHFSRISDTDSHDQYFIDDITPEYVVDPGTEGSPR